MPPTGARLSIIASRCAFQARSVSKAATTGRGLKMPCLEALRLTVSLPAGVLGPRRFASSLVCFGLMLAPLPGVPRSLYLLLRTCLAYLYSHGVGLLYPSTNSTTCRASQATRFLEPFAWTIRPTEQNSSRTPERSWLSPYITRALCLSHEEGNSSLPGRLSVSW